ncbi:MAG: hypothetical protein AAGH17_00010 [Pseudomonadota bacterium]
MTYGEIPMNLSGQSENVVNQQPGMAILTMKEADIPAGENFFSINLGATANGMTVVAFTYEGVDQTTPVSAMSQGTRGTVTTSYDVDITTAASSALVAFGTSIESSGQTPTTVSGDAKERLESLALGNSRAMMILATGENTTAGAKTVTFTPTTDGQSAVATAIEVFGI